MARKSFSGGTVDTTLSALIDSSQTTMTLVAGTTYPTTTNGPFVIAISRGSATEEKILVGTRAGNALSSCTRGYDGSTAQAHASGSTVSHVLDALTIDEANQIANVMTTNGDLMYRGASLPTRLAVPTTTTGQVLGIVSGVPAWVQPEYIGTLRQTMKTTADPGYALMGTTVVSADVFYATFYTTIAPAAWKSGGNLVLPSMTAGTTGAVWQVRLV